MSRLSYRLMGSQDQVATVIEPHAAATEGAKVDDLFERTGDPTGRFMRDQDFFRPHTDPTGRSLQHIHFSDKGGHSLGRRAIVNLLRRADLFQTATLHDRDSIRHTEGFSLIMSHIDKRTSRLALNAFELDLQLLSKPEIERAQRFIKQDDIRTGDEGARQSHALLLSS